MSRSFTIAFVGSIPQSLIMLSLFPLTDGSWWWRYPLAMVLISWIAQMETYFWKPST